MSISNAQSPTDVQNLQELILTESQTLDLKPGAYRYKILTLKANSKLRLFGSTSILAGKVITEKGARIEYVKGSSPQGQKILTLNAIDAAGLVDLTIKSPIGKTAQHQLVGLEPTATQADQEKMQSM